MALLLKHMYAHSKEWSRIKLKNEKKTLLRYVHILKNQDFFFFLYIVLENLRIAYAIFKLRIMKNQYNYQYFKRRKRLLIYGDKTFLISSDF